MTRLSRKIFLALLLVLSIAGSALAGLQNFTLYNYSGKTIKCILLNPSWKSSYDLDDIFTRDQPLWNGDSAVININTYPDEQFWDMKVLYTNDTVAEWRGLDLFNIYNIAIDRRENIHWNF